ncbi:MAG: UDP-GlcNAc--UDP-phosphate GlcNAc-1-phosphate transferase [Bacteroidetes bacterium]|nr:UDP-GlcNAc--UDP-phosphate GlcNAc-1-phosphate transferase [Bacteroidota bacterium]
MNFNLTQIIILTVAAIAMVPVFFSIARKINMVDLPNERSSHKHSTLRGAGIILICTVIVSGIFTSFSNWMLIAGLTIGAATGFIDDKFQLKAGLRALLYGIGCAMCLWSVPGFSELPIWIIPIIFIVALGTINAYNFMDGINGISIIYALVFCISLIACNQFLSFETDPTVLSAVLIASLVFAFMNVRKHALAFMGDVGSVFLGMIVVYWTVELCIQLNSIAFLGFLLVYGIDSVITIVERLKRREDIFAAHRNHLYQLLANELKWSHLSVSSIYGLIQLIINTGIIALVKLTALNGWIILAIAAVPAGILYLYIKFYFVKPGIDKLH